MLIRHLQLVSSKGGRGRGDKVFGLLNECGGWYVHIKWGFTAVCCSTVSVTMDMSENQENKHHHKRSKHSKHSRSKRKRKHRHHHHHHHHHHSKKKHHKHRSKVKLDERALLSALESLEADALDSIRVEVSLVPH